MKVKDKVFLITGLTFSFCVASIILEVVVKSYSLVAKDIESFLFFPGFDLSIISRLDVPLTTFRYLLFWLMPDESVSH